VSRQEGNLRRSIATDILRDIVNGKLAPRSRINESQLSAMLGVSRTPLREALFSLESLGLVEADPRRGFFVAPLSAREVRELYPIGRALDLLAVRSTARFSKVTCDGLASLNERFLSARRHAERARRLDRDFHRTLVSDCPNRRLLVLLENVQASMERYERAYMGDQHDVEHSAAQHSRIVRALRTNDLEAALEVLGQQWDYSLERLLLRLGELP